MTRWRRTKAINESTNHDQLSYASKQLYKALINYLNRNMRTWQTVNATIDFENPEPQYSPIIINGALYYADTVLLNSCFDINEHFIRYTLTDDAILKVEIDFDRSQPLGSFGHSITFA